MKLVSLISAFVLVLGLVIAGVLAASSQTITMNGSVNFNVTDRSLWVKEVRMQEAGGGTSRNLKLYPRLYQR